ncbi:MAG: alpha/beta hydrolase [Pseudomonadota bacterium]
MADTSSTDIWQDFECSATDGLMIRGRDYGSRVFDAMPVVCLPGLTRSVRDFDAIARRLSTDEIRPRRVLSINNRGRGTSDYDPNWKNYNPITEAQDVLSAITAAGLEDVVLFGTSRGGIISMLLGSMRPAIIKGVVLHDIGPEIDGKGLLRIKSYVTRMPDPKSWQDAADILKTIHQGSFPNYSPEDWMKSARLTFGDKNGAPAVDYDRNLSKTLESISPDQPIPTMWPQFMSLRSIPLLVIRGEISDLFSEKTLETMDRAHPTMQTVTVPQEGHVPNIMAENVLASLDGFLAGIDADHTH